MILKFFDWLVQKDSTVATVQINGQTYVGNDICIAGDKISIDGVVQQSGLSGIQTIRILDGSIMSLKSSASVQCGNVTGCVDAGGSVQRGNVGKDVDAGGSVNCGKVTGSIDAGGSVSIRN